MTDQTTLEGEGTEGRGARGAAQRFGLALVVIWAAREPERVGELLFLPPSSGSETYVFGRGGPKASDPHPRIFLSRQRPGVLEASAPLEDPFLSRDQLLLHADESGVLIENTGKRRLLGDHGEEKEIELAPGEIAELDGRLVLMCVWRPAKVPRLEDFPASAVPPFGTSDAYGLVGESPILWKMREHIAFVAARTAHVLVTGESGVGKELAAQAIHSLSKRRARALVARNAATIPAGLIDAELFGNVKNYPNAGMPERPGLFGEADGSTLFLDEIGELPESLQTRLLRVLDERGEYQQLGDARSRRSSFRLIGATNRPTTALKQDLAARFRLLLSLPNLNERREDIPLIARHLLKRAAVQDPDIGRRYFAGWDGATGEPRCSAALMSALVRHRYVTHVRELDTLLWRALSTSDGDCAELTPDVAALLRAEPPKARVATSEISADDVRAALARCNGVQSQAWRELGLANRYVLKRLIRKFHISA